LRFGLMGLELTEIILVVVMTLITTGSLWAAFSSRPPVGWRLLVLVALMAVVAAAATFQEFWTAPNLKTTFWGDSSSTSSFLAGDALSPDKLADCVWILWYWFVWMLMNALFSFGLLQVFAAAGYQLFRPRKQNIQADTGT